MSTTISQNPGAVGAAGRSFIQPGDIMIKHSDGSIANRFISFGQLFGRGKSKYTHAGIASSKTTIIEMDGNGLGENNLLTTNSSYKYEVFRCRYPVLAEGATETAKLMYEGFNEHNKFLSGQSTSEGMNISYSFLGAARSVSKRANWDGNDVINTQLDSLLKAGGTSYFCSGHVVLCYQATMGQHQMQGTLPAQHAQQIFGLEDSCYQPAFLHKSLSESIHFKYIGTVKATLKV